MGKKRRPRARPPQARTWNTLGYGEKPVRRTCCHILCDSFTPQSGTGAPWRQEAAVLVKGEGPKVGSDLSSKLAVARPAERLRTAASCTSHGKRHRCKRLPTETGHHWKGTGARRPGPPVAPTACALWGAVPSGLTWAACSEKTRSRPFVVRGFDKRPWDRGQARLCNVLNGRTDGQRFPCPTVCARVCRGARQGPCRHGGGLSC